MTSSHSSENSTFCSYAVWLVVAVFFVGLYLRSVGLSYPPYDAHGFRQTQTLSTIENFHEQGIDLLHPKAIYMGDPGTFVLEFPLFQAAAALLYGIFGPHIEIVRILNILFGAGGAWLVFRIGRRFWDTTTGVIAAMIYWMAPLNILYQRSMLIDPTAVFFGLLCFDQLAALLRTPVRAPESDREENAKKHFILFFLSTLITALIKSLYLWPAVFLFAQQIIARRFRPDRRMLQILVLFAFSGGCFLAWNIHATQVNNQSPFTRGVNPASHLGFSALLAPEFYKDVLFHRPKRWLGAIGILFYVAGILTACLQLRNRSQRLTTLLIFLIPPTYLVCFADINRPHEYYQLIITPFLAIMSAYGVTQFAAHLFRRFSQSKSIRNIMVATSAAFFLLLSAYTYLGWMRAPNLDKPIQLFETLVAGKFAPKHRAMVFVSCEVSGVGPDSYIPQYIYAANLWGYGRAVVDAQHARRYFDELAGAFPALDYLVFYGMPHPEWIPETYREELIDASHQLFVFRKNT